MPDLTAAPPSGLLSDIHAKLLPFGFKKIDSPKSYADFIEYLERLNFIDPDEPATIHPKDHVWIRVEQDAAGQMFHSIFMIPHDVDVTPTTYLVNMQATFIPDEGGDMEDATIHSASIPTTIRELLNMPDARLASKLSSSVPAASGNSIDLSAPVRPGSQTDGSTGSRALMALRRALSYFSRRP